MKPSKEAHTLSVPPTPRPTRKLHIGPKIVRYHTLFRTCVRRWRTIRRRTIRLLAIAYIGIRVSEKRKRKGNSRVNVIAKILQGEGNELLWNDQA